MRIAIIGGGAIGLLFSYYMNLVYDVTLFVRNEKQKEKINNDGLFLMKEEKKYSMPLKVKMIQQWENDEFDLSIICVKQYHLSQLLPICQKMNHPLLFVQNGMGHLHMVETLPAKNIFIGSVEHGALRRDENTFVHTGIGKTRIAIFRGGDEQFLQSFIAPFSNDFPFCFEQNYLHMLEKKLVVNAVINPLTAILQVKNGCIIENDNFSEVVKQLFEEISNVLSLGEKKEEFYENVLQVAKKTAKNESSMLKDIRAGRQTEVDAILGYLMSEATRKNIKVPLIMTLFHFIKGLEQEGGGR